MVRLMFYDFEYISNKHELWNNIDYDFVIDSENDSVIDLKFLLANKINTKPEYIQFVTNFTQRTFNNNSSLFQNGITSNITKIDYCLEIADMNNNDKSKNNSSFLIKSQPMLYTIPKVKQNIGAAFAKNPHLAQRKWLNVETKQRGDYEWNTFEEINNMVIFLGSGLGKLLKICAMNRMEWLLADCAGHTQGFVTVPLYGTLYNNSIEYNMDHAICVIIIIMLN